MQRCVDELQRNVNTFERLRDGFNYKDADGRDQVTCASDFSGFEAWDLKAVKVPTSMTRAWLAFRFMCDFLQLQLALQHGPAFHLLHHIIYNIILYIVHYIILYTRVGRGCSAVHLLLAT